MGIPLRWVEPPALEVGVNCGGGGGVGGSVLILSKIGDVPRFLCRDLAYPGMTMQTHHCSLGANLSIIS